MVFKNSMPYVLSPQDHFAAGTDSAGLFWKTQAPSDWAVFFPHHAHWNHLFLKWSYTLLIGHCDFETKGYRGSTPLSSSECVALACHSEHCKRFKYAWMHNLLCIIEVCERHSRFISVHLKTRGRVNWRLGTVIYLKALGNILKKYCRVFSTVFPSYFVLRLESELGLTESKPDILAALANHQQQQK